MLFPLHRLMMILHSSWSFEFRTIETDGGLLYNMGMGSRSDYICLEILGSRLRLLIGKGSNVMELVPEKNVSDGLWHNVSLTYSPVNIEVSFLLLPLKSWILILSISDQSGRDNKQRSVCHRQQSVLGAERRLLHRRIGVTIL